MSREQRQGPISHKIMIYLFAAILTLLLIWAIGYILSDIGHIEGPSWKEVEAEAIGSQLLNRRQKLKDDEAGIVVRIDNEKENQRILKTGMDSSKETMDQLLELHRLALEKNVKPTLGQQDALAESQTLYLANQKQFQQANDQITVLTGQQRQLQRKIDEVTEKIDILSNEARQKFETLMRGHR